MPKKTFEMGKLIEFKYSGKTGTINAARGQISAFFYLTNRLSIRALPDRLAKLSRSFCCLYYIFIKTSARTSRESRLFSQVCLRDRTTVLKPEEAREQRCCLVLIAQEKQVLIK